MALISLDDDDRPSNYTRVFRRVQWVRHADQDESGKDVGNPAIVVSRGTAVLFTERSQSIVNCACLQNLPQWESGMRYVVIGALMLLTASSRPAGATGVCENNPRRYDPPVRYSATEKRLAFEGSQDFCNETETPSAMNGAPGNTIEERGTAHFIEVRDLKNTVVERLSSARGETLNQVSAAVDKVQTVPSGKMEATLKARGFVPIAAGVKSPAGGCTVRTTWQRADTQNGFPAGVLTAEVVSRKKVITSVDLGLVAQKRNSEVALRASFLASERALLLWSRVPQCVGGPPPGHFDKSDPGICYTGDDIAIQLLTVAAHPELASCFAPVAAPP